MKKWLAFCIYLDVCVCVRVCLCVYVCACVRACCHFQFLLIIFRRDEHTKTHTQTHRRTHTHTPTHQRSNTQKRIHHTQKILNWWYRHIHTVKYSGNSWTICRIGCSDGRRSLQPLNGRLEWSRNSRKAPTHHALRDNRTERRGADLRAISRSAANPRDVAPYPTFQHLASRNVFQN